MTRYNKAFAAAVVTVLAFILTEFGVELPDQVQIALVTIATTFFVWLVPNDSHP